MAEQYVISVVLEGNASSMNNASKQVVSGQKQVKQSTEAANIAFLAQIARYQAMTAALNQTVGGFNKLAGGLDRLGWKEQAAMIRKGTAALEIIAGPAEIYLAYLTLTIAMGKKDIATKTGQTAATGRLTLATRAMNKAFLANPLFMIAAALAVVIYLIMSLDGRVKKLTDVVWPLVEVFERLQVVTDGVIHGIRVLNNLVNDFSLDGLNKKLNDSFIGGGGGASTSLGSRALS
jgi:ethanolamine utilization microcompartment shell protein EutS|tara:strand:+ start:584 stop:1285 length:702 start_codon:yes stop_codon:yes gene_type:complete